MSDPTTIFDILRQQSKEDKGPHLDVRGAAIDMCDRWRKLLRSPKSMTNALGLIKRTKLLQLAQTLYTNAAKAGWDTGRPEHPDMPAARLAVADWIVHTISLQPRFMRPKATSSLDRFFWGYLEQTAIYDAFFESRKANLNEVPSAAALAKSCAKQVAGPCYFGFAYGAPSLGALLSSGKGIKGRGRFRQLGINNAFWQVLDKNTAAKDLIQLNDRLWKHRETVLQTSTDKEALIPIPDDIANQAEALVSATILSNRGGPQFIVAKSASQKMRLHLAVMPEQGCSRWRRAEDPQGWRRSRQGLFEALPDSLMRNFEPLPDQPKDGWGRYETLVWCLSPVEPGARRHSQIFT